MQTICTLFAQTCCCCYRCQRILNCGDCCYKLDKNQIEKQILKEKEEVKIDWQDLTIQHNLGKNAKCEQYYFGSGKVCVTDKAIYVKTNPSPFCGLCSCFQLCCTKCYSCFCNIGIPIRIPLEDITPQILNDNQVDLQWHLLCKARTYDQPSVTLSFINGSSIVLLMKDKDKIENWNNIFPKLVSEKKKNPEKAVQRGIEISQMQRPLMGEEKQCFI